MSRETEAQIALDAIETIRTSWKLGQDDVHLKTLALAFSSGHLGLGPLEIAFNKMPPMLRAGTVRERGEDIPIAAMCLTRDKMTSEVATALACLGMEKVCTLPKLPGSEHEDTSIETDYYAMRRPHSQGPILTDRPITSSEYSDFINTWGFVGANKNVDLIRDAIEKQQATLSIQTSKNNGTFIPTAIITLGQTGNRTWLPRFLFTLTHMGFREGASVRARDLGTAFNNRAGYSFQMVRRG
jgi:hypothetical protein